MRASVLLTELVDVIGVEATTDLAENFGGLRLYVPVRLKADNEIVRAIGDDASRKLIARFAPDYIRVPLARELRFRRLRDQGLSNRRIAVTLGVTEAAIDKMSRRLTDSCKLLDRQ